MTDYEACYVFTPDEPNSLSERPPKRSKIGRVAQPAGQDDFTPFVPLLRGLEKPENIIDRYKTYEYLWRPREEHINTIVHDANADAIQDLASFVISDDGAESVINPLELNSANSISRSRSKIHTGLVLTGPDSNISSEFFQSVAEQANLQLHTILVNLTSGQSPNLKTILKYINQHGTSQASRLDDETDIEEAKNGRLLNYDLQILYDYVKSHDISRVILSFQDSEAFDAKLLADLVDVLSSWNHRIPFVLLFSIATSVELFQAKLSRNTIRRLRGTEFSVEHADVDEIFKAIHSGQPSLWLGPGLGRWILQRQRDYVQSPLSFGQALKYAYMTHFFANPLSCMLGDKITLASFQKEQVEAVRNLPSFRRFAQRLLDKGDYGMVRALLDDEESLYEAATEGLVTSQEALLAMIAAIQVLSIIQSFLVTKSHASWSEMYIEAMSGELNRSALFEDVMNSMKQIPSNIMADLLESLSDSPLAHEMAKLKVKLCQLTDRLDDPDITFRSKYDVHHETLRTTIVAQKVSLSKNSATLSAEDAAYTKIVDRAYTLLSEFFQATFINPKDLFLHEVFIYDSKSPHRDVFTSKPRFAIERALSSPHDYLACDCCGGADGGLSATQPATAILYQLYLESGAVINTADLWSAFWTIVGAEGSEDEEAEQQRALALFSRALAELKYMGMIKNSRKKADHLAKLSWKGL